MTSKDLITKIKAFDRKKGIQRQIWGKRGMYRAVKNSKYYEELAKHLEENKDKQTR